MATDQYTAGRTSGKAAGSGSAKPAPKPAPKSSNRPNPTRSAIERIISWTATQHGRRVRLRYIGTTKNNAWLHNRCAAINLRTLLNARLARRDGAWVLA